MFKFNTRAMRRKSIDIARARYNAAARDLHAQALAAESPIEREALERVVGQLRDRAAALRGINANSTLESSLKTLIKDSDSFLRRALNNDWMRGEALGNLRLSGTTAGHRFYALTESMWSGAAPGKRLDAIRKAVAKNPEVVAKFGKRPNTSQLIQIIQEATGVELDVDDQFIDQTDKELFLKLKAILMRNYG